jgi:hypothetical protein
MNGEDCRICGFQRREREYEFEGADGVCDLCRRLKLEHDSGDEANDVKRAICHVGNVLLEAIWHNGQFNDVR